MGRDSQYIQQLKRSGCHDEHIDGSDARGLIAQNVRIYDFKNRENTLAVISEVALDINYSAFRRGSRYHYFGGYYKQTPVRLVPPHEGSWHVVLHLGGYAGRVNASMSLN